jgi:exopolysaccharide biosynthesis polyprenyl glycosylphosphotransferase
MLECAGMKRVNLAFAAMLVPLDYLALIAAAVTAYSLRFTSFFVNLKPIQFGLTFQSYMEIVLPIAIVYLGVFALAGLYTIRPRSITDELTRIMLACSAALALVLAIAFFSRELFESRFIILAVLGFTIAFVFAERLAIRAFQRALRIYGVGSMQLAVIGKTKSGNALVNWFNRFPSFGYRPVMQVAHFSQETIDRILQLKRKDKIDGLLLANPDASKEEIAEIKAFADINHLTFFYSADLFPGSTLRPLVHTLAGRPLIEVPTTPLDGWGAIYKRCFDILGALILIILSLPIQIAVALALFLEQPGSVLFRKLPDGKKVMRVGQGGKIFPYFKFRSMVKDAHKYRFDPKFIAEHGNMREGTPLFKLENDPRVTRIGRFIRKYSIDEIPEFYLVLLGRMSLVGPRPHLPEEVALYKPEYRKVLTIKPGITGLSQIGGRANLDFDDEVRLDMYYIENWRPWMDLLILFKTPLAVLFRRGAY